MFDFSNEGHANQFPKERKRIKAWVPKEARKGRVLNPQHIDESGPQWIYREWASHKKLAKELPKMGATVVLVGGGENPKAPRRADCRLTATEIGAVAPRIYLRGITEQNRP